MKEIEIKGDARVEWMYPNIYQTEPLSTLTIGLCHVRAADGIRIKYDGDRDGWVIEQASRFIWQADETPDPDWQEVAFVQAWAREVKPQWAKDMGL